MNSPLKESSDLQQARPLRFITAASLFDGHDAAINIMRRIMQQQGAEVIHLGHNRGVDEIVLAALQEDVDGIAISSYQGGHIEYFKYMIDLLKEAGAEHIQVFGGGGGVIVAEEIAELQDYGVAAIYSPEDGRNFGLDGMIGDMLAKTATAVDKGRSGKPADSLRIGQQITRLELDGPDGEHPGSGRQPGEPPVIGITGPGGAGKSSLTDELIQRFLRYFPDLKIAVLAVDPTRRRTGGALLGDRIRMNSLRDQRIFMRSIATRRSHLATSAVLDQVIDNLCDDGFGLVLLETAGIGQSDSEVIDLVDYSIYVMTSEYGAASQLEKIDMLDLADLVVLNKFEKRGAEDALRDVRKQWQRNRQLFDLTDDQVPVFPTIASQFNDIGVNQLFVSICQGMANRLGLDINTWTPALETSRELPSSQTLIPAKRVRYLAEIAEQGRNINRTVEIQAGKVSRAWHCHQSLLLLDDAQVPEWLDFYPSQLIDEGEDSTLQKLRREYQSALGELSDENLQLLREWPARREAVVAETYSYQVRGREIVGDNYFETLSRLKIPKIAPPKYSDPGDQLRYLGRENLPGAYPYTGGVYPYRRQSEDPVRMFAGEGTPERTNRRFHYLAGDHDANRLSTAFDSVTLYGEDPHPRPDIYGKVGNSGVSIASLDDAKKLYSGFDLCDSLTSVSLTINGPAPMILAFFLNTAIDQQVEKHLRATGGWEAAEKTIAELYKNHPRPTYQGELPVGNDGLGLGMLGVTGDQLVDAETYARIRSETLAQVRGTVQADILKEDQAQNTCIFSTEFAMRMMGDVQEWFTDVGVRNFYSVSISGYHIAEAGANPISQLAFTLSNGFTIVEYYLARGMQIDDFAPNLSFFFSNGMDAEYAVLGRVARRIWARAMRERYGASPRGQMMKYHIQTSGRSLHAQEVQFNDIRTTLQALYALYDSCNSLHTNAYDEAITTPTEESVRRAVAIQLIINRELGLNRNENPMQGSFVIDELTDLVEEAVYQEFERLSERGGVLGAMETMYQRGKIQDESMDYEHRKHDGSLPIIGVNTFLDANAEAVNETTLELVRSSAEEKQQQIDAVNRLHEFNRQRAEVALQALQQQAVEGKNTFGLLMETAKCCSLGQISGALYQVGGEYRRSM